MEKRVPLDGLRDPEKVALRIERVTEETCRDGWYFVSAITDDWVDSVTLFFEKELEV